MFLCGISQNIAQRTVRITASRRARNVPTYQATAFNAKRMNVCYSTEKLCILTLLITSLLYIDIWVSQVSLRNISFKLYPNSVQHLILVNNLANAGDSLNLLDEPKISCSLSVAVTCLIRSTRRSLNCSVSTSQKRNTQKWKWRHAIRRTATSHLNNNKT